MCILAFHWDPGGPAPLTVAGNRDEFLARPTAPLAWWGAAPILAGRDLQAGGTWLGLSRSGRFAALTNHRNPALARPGGPSRGLLPVRFLKGSLPAAAFLETLRTEASVYSPFNLLLFDGEGLLGYESRQDRVLAFAPGLHGVSNGDFDEPWPKLQALLAGLDAELHDDEALFRRLQDDRPFPDDALPHTGVDQAWERGLSPIFVRLAGYGTRSAAVVRFRHGQASLEERRFGPDGAEGVRREAITWPVS